MTTRITVDQFFKRLKARSAYPLVDTAQSRAAVEKHVRALCSRYPIKERWPVLDLESSYELFLNSHADLHVWRRKGYMGTIHAGPRDDTYSFDEWFGDFREQWCLVDTPEVRLRMSAELSNGPTWKSPELYSAHAKATKSKTETFLQRMFG